MRQGRFFFIRQFQNTRLCQRYCFMIYSAASHKQSSRHQITMKPSQVKQFPEDPSTLKSAPLWRRFAAMFYDAILVLAVWFVTTMAYLLLKGMVYGAEAMKVMAESERGLADPLLSTCLFLSTFYFFAYFWTRIGQTLGMQVWRIRIQNPDGFKVNWSQSLLRFFTAMASAACFGLGYLWMLWDRDRLTWPDRASMTRVYYIPAKRVETPAKNVSKQSTIKNGRSVENTSKSSVNRKSNPPKRKP